MKHNRDRLFEMLKYIEKKDLMVDPIELVAKFIPSMYELNLIYNKTYKGKYFGITIDMKDATIKGAIRKAYQLKNEEDFSSDEILRYLRS